MHIVEDTAVKPADFFVAKERENALKMVVARHLGEEEESDHDEAAAREWRSKLSRWEREVMAVLDSSLSGPGRPRREFFNFESSPSAHFKRFIAKKKRREPDPESLMNKPWFAQAVTAGAFAMVLAIALARMNLGLVQRINSYTDRLFVDPVISAAFLFSGPETLAKIGIDEAPAAYRTPPLAKEAPDKNILASFIVNHGQDLGTGNKAEATYMIPAEKLDGRIAGAYEARAVPPSKSLLAISVQPRALDRVKARVGQALLGLAKLQITASDKVYEWLTSD